MVVRRITVPKTPKSAYNPNRPVSGLLKAQIAMLEQASLSYDPVAAIRRRPPQTEGEAARYIQKLHAALQSQLARAANERAALSLADAKSALGSRSVTTRDGGKRWPATAGPSADARRRSLAPGAPRQVAPRKAAAKGKRR